MTSPTTVAAHTSGLCPLCHEPYAEDGQPCLDVAAVNHLVTHGPRAVAFALLVADAHRVLAEAAPDFTRERVRQVCGHLDQVADEQRPATTGGEGW